MGRGDHVECIIGADSDAYFPTPIFRRLIPTDSRRIRMPSIAKLPKLPKLVFPAIVALLVAGCGLLYKQPIHQGNLIEKSAADQLQVGMSKQQVTTLLGSPSIADPFHQQRWDYTASQRTGRRARTEVKTLTLWFENDALTKWEGEYFPEQDEALAVQMRRFGNLPKDKDKEKRR
jgi:outer membrane protein assembly factor BamE